MSESESSFEPRVRSTLANHAGLPVDIAHVRSDDDLFQAGMTSHASINVMLALEVEFDIEFPEAMLQRTTFESIDAICASLSDLCLIGEAI